MKELEPTSVESSELVEQTFDFWFNNKDHIRSPFPEYIRPELKDKAVKRFHSWTSGLTDKASKEVNDTIVAEKFEEIIFEIAMELVITEDEKLTVNYPFMPRVGDKIKDDNDDGEKSESVIKDRSVVKDDDRLYLKVKLEKLESGEKWETKFELPA
jgi:hypothetical protein